MDPRSRPRYRDEYSNTQNESSIRVDTFEQEQSYGQGGQGPPYDARDQVNQFGSNMDTSSFTLLPEDLVLMRECSRESFIYRSLPAMIISAGVVRYIHSRKPFTNLLFPYIGAGMFGFLFGRITYRTQCMKKFIYAKHSSPLVDAIRKYAGVEKPEIYDDTVSTGVDYNSPSSSAGYENYNKWDPGMDSEYTENKDNYSSWRNRLEPRSTESQNYDENDPDVQVKRNVTYDDLRAQNRAKYQAPGYSVTGSSSGRNQEYPRRSGTDERDRDFKF